MDPLHVSFRHKLSKVLVFANQISLFHENPVSSVRPCEASSGRFLCFHPDSKGLFDFRLLYPPETMAPVATGAMAPVDTGECT